MNMTKNIQIGVSTAQKAGPCNGCIQEFDLETLSLKEPEARIFTIRIGIQQVRLCASCMVRLFEETGDILDEENCW